jgi:multidrug efflux pump subunit AcrA (membrane-fusion protein)
VVEGVLIEGDALRSDANGDYVWRVSEGIVERRAVEVGGSRDRGRVLITRGLETGDTVVRSAEKPLNPGQAVKTR